MLTIFSSPKPFRGHINIIQRNAFKSWTLLEPEPEVILIGGEEGVKDVAQELKVRHISGVKKNEYGTPMVNSVFSIAEKEASHDILCYCNSDIILMSGFISEIKYIIQELLDFLIVGHRYDLDMNGPIDFSTDWEQMIKIQNETHGIIHGKTGIDFFIFRRNTFDAIPSFALGRTIWDNWLIYKARLENIPVIDISSVVKVIHQNHNYSHCRGGDVWQCEEAKRNLMLAGGYGHTFNLMNSSHKLTKKGLRKNISFARFYVEANRFIRRILKR